MVNLGLPSASRVRPGKTWPRSATSEGLREFRVYRYDPNRQEGPRLNTFVRRE